MTVRHTPFTARLSPADSSLASGEATRSRNPPLVGFRSISSPTASTRPVNIPLYHHVRVQRLDVTLHERSRGKPPPVEELETACTNDMRRDVQPHVVNKAGIPRRRVQRGAAFEQ